MSFTGQQETALKTFADFLMGGRMASKAGGKAAQAEPAPLEKLQGKGGDPEIKKDPKFWRGQSFIGQTYSDCPPEYLEKVAEELEWGANKDQQQASPKCNDKGEPWWKFSLWRASVARGWARENVAMAGKFPERKKGEEAPEPVVQDAGTGDDNVPY